MKKLIISLGALIFLGCTGPIVGDSYIVTKVEKQNMYKKLYKVEIRCLDVESGCNAYTWYGNVKTLYTNYLYTVDDTVKIK